MTHTRRALGLAMTAISVVVIGVLTLTPQPAFATIPFGHWCVVCGPTGTADVVANVLLFMPLGFGLGLAGVPWWRATVGAALYSVSIELAQLLIVSGRFATLSDVLTNTTGAALATALATHRRAWVRPRPRVAAWLTGLVAATVVGVLAGSAWTFATPVDPERWSARVDTLPTVADSDAFPGRVQRATVHDFTVVPTGPGPVSVTAPTRRVALAEVEVQVQRRRDRSPSLAPILLVHAPDAPPTAPWLVLAQNGRTFVLEAGQRARHLGLHQPTVGIREVRAWRRRDDGSAPGIRDTSFTLRGIVSGDRLTIALEQGAVRRGNTVRLAPTLGWALLSPIPTIDSPEAGLATAMWLAGLTLPLGYFARWGGRGRRGAEVAAATGILATIACGLVVVPHVWGFATGRPWEWVAGIGGALCGAAIGETVRRLSRSAVRAA